VALAAEGQQLVVAALATPQHREAVRQDAGGYSACFLGVMKLMAGQRKIALPADTSIEADVNFDTLAQGKPGCGIAVAMRIHVLSPDKARVQEVVDAAHVACPCSNATRNNVDVTLTVVSTLHLPPAGYATRAGTPRPAGSAHHDCQTTALPDASQRS
jgi:Ohr subfamily peroxiredoxin